MSTSVRTTTVTETSEWYDGAFLLSLCSESSIREDDSGSGTPFAPSGHAS